MSYQSAIKDYIEYEKKILDMLDTEAIEKAILLIERTAETSGRVYIFGNGGSAATASHFQNDFNKGLSENLEKKFDFRCLSDNVATITAIANDIGYDEIYREQLKGRLKEGDVVFAISGSGNSANIINAVRYALDKKIPVIGLTGYDGGELAKICDVSVHVPVMSMQMAEDIHMIMDHLMMAVLYRQLCGIEHLK